MKKPIVNIIMYHPKLGNVLILSKKPNSRTVYSVEQVDRGKGWNEVKQTYTGFKFKLKDGIRWNRGENKDFGKVQDVHIKELKPITK